MILLHMGQNLLSRLSLLLTLIIVVLSVAFTLRQQILKWSEPTVSFDKQGIKQLFAEFMAKHEVVQSFRVDNDLSAYLPQSLLTAKNIFPDVDRVDEPLWAQLLADESCDPTQLKTKDDDSAQLKKFKVFRQYQCHQVETLPEFLWKEKPLIHPQGGSWANFLYEHLERPYSWLLENRNWLHFLELKAIEESDRSEFDRFASHFTPYGLNLLNQGAPHLILEDWVFSISFFSPDETNYWAYKITDWNNFLKSNNIKTLPINSTSCTFREHGFCWAPLYSQNKLVDPDTFYNGLSVAILLLALLLILNLVEKSRLKDDFRQKQQLVMQTLAHELRHPVTGLRLSVDAFRDEYDSLPDNLSTEFLRLVNISERMSKLVINSQQYLKLLSDTKKFSFRMQKIDSISDFIESSLQDYEGKVEFAHGESSKTCLIDGFWVSTCLQNLVVNALTHGKQPIVVRWQCKDDDLFIEVQDQGHIKATRIDQLLDQKIPRSASRGLGVGLNLVHRLIHLMKGKLTFKQEPSTTFVIHLQGVCHEKDTAC